MALIPTKIIGPAIFSASLQGKFEFAAAAQAQSGITYQAQWVQLDGTPFDLTGATVDATITVGTSVFPNTGVITITNPLQGLLTWEPEEEDTAFAGVHTLQFQASFGVDDIVYSFPMDWQVAPTNAANASPTSPLVGVPASDAACLAAFCAAGAGNGLVLLEDPPATLLWRRQINPFLGAATNSTWTVVDMATGSIVPTTAKIVYGYLRVFDNSSTGNPVEVEGRPGAVVGSNSVTLLAAGANSANLWSSYVSMPVIGQNFEINMNSTPTGANITVTFQVYAYS